MTSASVAPGGAGPGAPLLGGSYTELLLPYDPSTLVDTVRKRRRRLVSRLISLGISLVLLGGLFAWQHRAVAEQGGAYWVFTGIVLALSLIPLVVVLLAFLRARTELRGVPAGIAVRMGRPGVVVGNAFARWPDVAALEVVPGGLGRADRLRLLTRAGATG
ncbi:MAG TPA: hypothetical protein VGC37_11275, partial [Friedmanniella sp.]